MSNNTGSSVHLPTPIALIPKSLIAEMKEREDGERKKYMVKKWVERIDPPIGIPLMLMVIMSVIAYSYAGWAGWWSVICLFTVGLGLFIVSPGFIEVRRETRITHAKALFESIESYNATVSLSHGVSRVCLKRFEEWRAEILAIESMSFKERKKRIKNLGLLEAAAKEAAEASQKAHQARSGVIESFNDSLPAIPRSARVPLEEWVSAYRDRLAKYTRIIWGAAGIVFLTIFSIAVTFIGWLEVNQVAMWVTLGLLLFGALFSLYSLRVHSPKKEENEMHQMVQKALAAESYYEKQCQRFLDHPKNYPNGPGELVAKRQHVLETLYHLAEFIDEGNVDRDDPWATDVHDIVMAHRELRDDSDRHTLQCFDQKLEVNEYLYCKKHEDCIE